MLIFHDHSLFEHGVTREEVEQVLQDPRTVWLDLGVSPNGNDRLMFVGLTDNGRLLEVGVELIAEDDHVFHAMNATKQYRECFANAK